ncbi:MAG: hypothetical protein AAGG68_29610 [Bacteroidota bacterium]
MITKNGKIQKIYLDGSEACDKELVYTIVEEMPTYKGGLKQLEDDLNRATLFDKRVNEKFYLKCTVNCKGGVSGFQSINSHDSEAIRRTQSELLRLQNWESGKHRGIQVDCFYTLVVKVKRGKIKIDR